MNRRRTRRQEALVIDAYMDADLDLTALLVDGSDFRPYCGQGTWIYVDVSTMPARQIIVQCRPREPQ